MQNMAEKNEANIIAQDAHSDAKGEVFNADDARLQQMGASYLTIDFNMH
jgi:choline transport protein